MRMIFDRLGFASEIARHLGVTPQSVSLWTQVPVRHVHAIAPLIGMTPEEIRPDIFKPTKRR